MAAAEPAWVVVALQRPPPSVLDARLYTGRAGGCPVAAGARSQSAAWERVGQHMGRQAVHSHGGHMQAQREARRDTWLNRVCDLIRGGFKLQTTNTASRSCGVGRGTGQQPEAGSPSHLACNKRHPECFRGKQARKNQRRQPAVLSWAGPWWQGLSAWLPCGPSLLT